MNKIQAVRRNRTLTTLIWLITQNRYELELVYGVSRTDAAEFIAKFEILSRYREHQGGHRIVKFITDVFMLDMLARPDV